jgi:hypothetical protein
MQRERAFVTRKGVTYFSRATERRVFFILTLGMLVLGIVEKWG